MSFSPLPSIETIKRWVDYWRKFKGKRVRIWLKTQMKLTKDLFLSTSIEMGFSESVAGIISDVIESPFGIKLEGISSTEIETIFIPMSEIARMDFLKETSEQHTS